MIANLRVFVSSTCLDLFQERRDIANALLSMNHNVILSEMSNKMPVNPKLSTVDSCFEAIQNHADLLVLIISGRYGSSDDLGKSVTMREYIKAKELGIPVIAFVRKTIWDLKYIWARNKNGDYKPFVEDNNVFELITLIETQKYGNWIFPFVDAKEIIEILTYQLSSLLRLYLFEEQKLRRELYFKYVNQFNVMLNNDGLCYRSVQYCLVNNTGEPISNYLVGDTMDKELSIKDFNLKIWDEFGRKLKYNFTVDTPNYKRWDIFFREPLLQKQSLKFYTQYISCDQNQYQGQHTRHVQEGIITYVFPASFLKKKIKIEIRDQKGWSISKNASVYKNQFGLNIIIPYSNVDSVHQFRIRWS